MNTHVLYDDEFGDEMHLIQPNDWSSPADRSLGIVNSEHGSQEDDVPCHCDGNDDGRGHGSGNDCSSTRAKYIQHRSCEYDWTKRGHWTVVVRVWWLIWCLDAGVPGFVCGWERGGGGGRGPGWSGCVTALRLPWPYVVVWSLPALCYYYSYSYGCCFSCVAASLVQSPRPTWGTWSFMSLE